MDIERSRERSRSAEKPSKFQINSRSFFLTYPKLDLSKEEALHLLQLKLAGKPITGAVVCRELHEDGSPHIHAYILLETRFNCRNKNFWDLNGHHGNYQMAKSIEAVSKYIKKDGDFIEYGTLDWKEKVNARAEHRRCLGAKMLEPGTTLKDILLMDPSLALEAHNLERALTACKQAFITPLTTDDVKGIWIFGPAGVGKSHLVREIEPSLYLKSQNKWWDTYNGEPSVLIDDFDKMGTCLSHYIKIWADKYGCVGEKKGSQTPLCYSKFYITSNYSPDELWGVQEDRDLELIAAIKRRFKFYYMESREKYEDIKKALLN